MAPRQVTGEARDHVLADPPPDDRGLGGFLAAFAGGVGAPHSERWSMKVAGRVLDAPAAPEGKLSYRAPYSGLRGLLRLPREYEWLVSSAEGELWPLPD